MSDPDTESDVPRHRRQKSAVRQAVVRFTTSSLIALLVLMLAVFLLASRIARQEALRDARTRGYAIGHLIAAPLVNAKVRAHAPGAGAELNTVMRRRMGDGSVIHVVLWSRSGEVIWSDRDKLVGQTFPVADDMKALFGTAEVKAEVADLGGPENVGQGKPGESLEVYAGTRDADQVPMVFEAYFSADSMNQDERAIINGLLPIIIAALLLFQFAVLPLALSLARRVERGQRERSRWMRHALLASDLERRRIAQDLHDGVIQDLAGLCYVMPTLEAQLPPDSATGTARKTSHRVSEILRRDVAALRTMITDIYPPDLQGPGLVAAVQDLARGAGEQGVQVEVQMPPNLTVPVDTARLAYRVVREGLRNVAKHARATTALVQVRRESDRLVVLVSDNGRGVQDGPVAGGHLGLRLLEDTVRDFGGQVTLLPSPSGGAMLEASFPVRLGQPSASLPDSIAPLG